MYASSAFNGLSLKLHSMVLSLQMADQLILSKNLNFSYDNNTFDHYVTNKVNGYLAFKRETGKVR